MLICVATCRNADKKLHDNTLEKLATMEPIDNTFNTLLGGDVDIRMNEIEGMAQAYAEAERLLNNSATKAAMKMSNIIGTEAALVANAHAISAFDAALVSQGKSFAPLPGNRH